MTEEESDALFQKALDILGEHFHSVQIVATLYDPQTKTSDIIGMGVGDVYARVGAMKEWVMLKDEEMKQRVRNAIDKEGNQSDNH